MTQVEAVFAPGYHQRPEVLTHGSPFSSVIPDARSAIRNPGATDANVAPVPGSAFGGPGMTELWLQRAVTVKGR